MTETRQSGGPTHPVARAPRPANEVARLAALARYDLLDTPPEASFDRLARLCARLFDAPIAMVSVVGEERQSFKACVGSGMTGNTRDLAFCSYTILQDGPDDVLVVPDAALDPRFMHNPVVLASGIRFYAGVPLRSSDGYAIGTLCIYDLQPREHFSPEDRALLSELAALAADVMERRQAETELRALTVQLGRQQRRFQLALTKARMAVWAIDLADGKMVVHADLGALGLSAAQVPSHYQELAQLMHPGDLRRMMAGLDQTIAEGRDFEAHYRLLLPGQPLLWVGVRGSVEHGAQGQPLRLLGVAYDVTEERRAVRAQAESEGTLRAIIEHTDDLVTLKDTQGRFLLVNPAAARALGHPPEAVLGHTEAELLGQTGGQAGGQTGGPALNAAEQAVLAGGQMQSYEHVVNAPPDADPQAGRVWLTTKFPYLVSGQERRGVIGISRDITELKRAEDLLRGANTVLERQVEARTERLSEINAELTAFAASMSAEVREPLRRLEGFLDLLQKRCEGHDDPTALRYLSVMRRESHRVTLLLQDLSEYARSGRRELQVNRVALSQLLVQVRSDLEPLFRSRRVQWDVGELPTVLGDPMLLRQALTNVLHNALKFTREETEARIRVESWIAGGEAIVCVTDNGIGFEGIDAPRLFHIFTRLHDGRFEGAGVGLANVRRMVVRHGGRCWAEGTPGQGASIYIALPQLPE